jgi:DNA-binding transcriptional regulator YiaG
MKRIEMNGTELKEMRTKRLRLRQDQFGAVCGVHLTTVSDWERNDAKVPHYAALLATLMADDPLLREKVLQIVGV